MTTPIDSKGNVHDENGRFVSLETYMNRILEEKDKALQVALSAQQQALHLASQRMEQRLEGLNELRAEVLTDRNRFVTREVFDAEMAPLRDLRSRAALIVTGVALIASALGALVTTLVSQAFGGS